MKLYSAQIATEIALEAVQLHGGNGYMAEFRSSSSPATPRCCRSTPGPTRSRPSPSPAPCWRKHRHSPEPAVRRERGTMGACSCANEARP